MSVEVIQAIGQHIVIPVCVATVAIIYIYFIFKK